MTSVGNLRFFRNLKTNYQLFLLCLVFMVLCLNYKNSYAIEDVYGYKNEYVNCNSIDKFDINNKDKTNYYSDSATERSDYLFYLADKNCEYSKFKDDSKLEYVCVSSSNKNEYEGKPNISGNCPEGQERVYKHVCNGGFNCYNDEDDCQKRGQTGYYEYKISDTNYYILKRNKGKPIALSDEKESEKTYNCYYKKYECDANINEISEADFKLNTNINNDNNYQLFKEESNCSGSGCFSKGNDKYIRSISSTSCTGYLPACDQITEEDANEYLLFESVDSENANLNTLGAKSKAKCLSLANENKSYCSDLVNGNLRYPNGVGDINNPNCFLKSCADLTSDELNAIKDKTGKFCSEYRYVRSFEGFKYLPYGANIAPVYCSDLNEGNTLKFPNGLNKNKDNCLLKRCVALTQQERDVVAKQNMLNVDNCIKSKTKEEIEAGACSKDKLPKYCDNEIFFINGPIQNFDDIKINTFPCSETNNITNKMLSFRDLFFNSSYSVINTKNYICRSNIVPVYKNDNLQSRNGSFLCSVLVTKNEGNNNDLSYDNNDSDNNKGSINLIEEKGYGPNCSYFGKTDMAEISSSIGGADKFVNISTYVDNIVAYLNADISYDVYKNILSKSSDVTLCSKIECDSSDSVDIDSSTKCTEGCNADEDCIKKCVSDNTESNNKECSKNSDCGENSTCSIYKNNEKGQCISTESKKLKAPHGTLRYYINPSNYNIDKNFLSEEVGKSYFDCNFYDINHVIGDVSYNNITLIGYDLFENKDKEITAYDEEGNEKKMEFIDKIVKKCKKEFVSLTDERTDTVIDVEKISYDSKNYFHTPIDDLSKSKESGKNPPNNKTLLGCHYINDNEWVEKSCKIPDLDSYYIASYTTNNDIKKPGLVEFSIQACLRHSDDIYTENSVCGLREGSQYNDKCLNVPVDFLKIKDDSIKNTYHTDYDKLKSNLNFSGAKDTTRITIHNFDDAKTNYFESEVIEDNHNFFRTERYGRNVYTFYDFLTNVDCNTSNDGYYTDNKSVGIIIAESHVFCASMASSISLMVGAGIFGIGGLIASLLAPVIYGACMGTSLGLRIPLEATFNFQNDTFYMKDYYENNNNGKGFYSNFNISDNNNYLYNYYRRGTNIEDDIKYKLEGSNGTYNDSTVLAKEIMKKCGLLDEYGNSKLIEKIGNATTSGAGEIITYTPKQLGNNGIPIEECYNYPNKCLSGEQQQCLREYGVYFFTSAQKLNEINDMDFLEGHQDFKYSSIVLNDWGIGKYGIISTGLVKYAGNNISKDNENCKLDIYGNPISDLEKCRGFKQGEDGDFIKENQAVRVGLQTAPPVFFKLLSKKNMSDMFNPTLKLSKFYSSKSNSPTDYLGQSFKLDLLNPKMIFNYEFNSENVSLRNQIKNSCNEDCGISNKEENDAKHSSVFVEIPSDKKDSAVYKVAYQSEKMKNANEYQYLYFFLRKTYKTDIKGSEIPLVCVHILKKENTMKVGGIEYKGRYFSISDENYYCFDRQRLSINELIFKPDDSYTYIKPFVNMAIKYDTITNIKDNFKKENLAYLNREVISDINNTNNKFSIEFTAVNNTQMLFFEFKRSDCSKLEIDYFQKQRDLYSQQIGTVQDLNVVTKLETEIKETIGQETRNSCEQNDGGFYYLYEKGENNEYNTYNRYKTKVDHTREDNFNEICMKKEHINRIREDNSEDFKNVVAFKVAKNGYGEHTKCLLDKDSRAKEECLINDIVYYDCTGVSGDICKGTTNEQGNTVNKNSKNEEIKEFVSSKTGRIVKAVGINCKQFFDGITETKGMKDKLNEEITEEDIFRIKICYKGGYNPYGNIYKNEYDSNGNLIKDYSCVCQKSSEFKNNSISSLAEREPTDREAGFCFDLPRTPKCETVKYYNAYKQFYDYDLPVFDTEYNEEKLCYRSVGGTNKVDNSGNIIYDDDKCYSEEANANQHLWRSYEKMLGFITPTSLSNSLGNAEFEDSVYCADNKNLCLNKESTDIKGQCNGFWKNNDAGVPIVQCVKLRNNTTCTKDANGNCSDGCIKNDNEECVADCKKDYDGNCIYEYQFVENKCQRYECPNVFIHETEENGSTKTTYYLNEVDILNNQEELGFKGFLKYENTLYNNIAVADFNSYRHIEESSEETLDKRGKGHGFATWKKTTSDDIMKLVKSSDVLTGFAHAGSNYARENINSLKSIYTNVGGFDTNFTGSNIDYDKVFSGDSSDTLALFVSLIHNQVSALTSKKIISTISDDYLSTYQKKVQRYCSQRGEWLDVRDVYSNIIPTTKLQPFFYSENSFWMNIIPNYINDNFEGVGIVDLSAYGKKIDGTYAGASDSVYSTDGIDNTIYERAYISNEDKKLYNERLFCPHIEIGNYIKNANEYNNSNNIDTVTKGMDYNVYDFEIREGTENHLTLTNNIFSTDNMNKEFTWKHTGGAKWLSVSAPRNSSSLIENNNDYDIEDNLEIIHILNNNDREDKITNKYLKVVQGDCQEEFGYFDKDVSLYTSFNDDLEKGFNFNLYSSEIGSIDNGVEFKTIDPRTKTLIEKEGILKPIRTCNSVGMWSGIGNKCLRACEAMNMYNTEFSDEAQNLMKTIYEKVDFSVCKIEKFETVCKNFNSLGYNSEKECLVGKANERMENLVSNFYRNISIIPNYIKNKDILRIYEKPNYFDVIGKGTDENNYFKNFPSSRYKNNNYDYKDNSLGHLKYFYTYDSSTNKSAILSYVYGDFLTGGASWPRAVANSNSGTNSGYDNTKKMNYVYVEGTCDDTFVTDDFRDSGINPNNIVTTMYIATGGNPRRRCYEDGTWGPVENRCILFRVCRTFGLTVQNMADIIFAYDKFYDLNRNNLRTNYPLEGSIIDSNFEKWFANYIKSSEVKNNPSDPIASFAVNATGIDDVLKLGSTSIDSVINNNNYLGNISLVNGLTCNFSTKQEEGNAADSESSWSIEYDLANVIQPLTCTKSQITTDYKSGNLNPNILNRLTNLGNELDNLDSNDRIRFYNKGSRLNEVYDVLYNINDESNISNDDVNNLYKVSTNSEITNFLPKNRIVFDETNKRYYYANNKNNNTDTPDFTGSIEFEIYKDVLIGKGEKEYGKKTNDITIDTTKTTSNYKSFQRVDRCIDNLFYNGEADSKDKAEKYNIVYECNTKENKTTAGFEFLEGTNNNTGYIIRPENCTPRFCGGEGNDLHGSVWSKSYITDVEADMKYYGLVSESFGSEYKDKDVPISSFLKCLQGYAFVVGQDTENKGGTAETLYEYGLGAYYGNGINEANKNVPYDVVLYSKINGWIDTLIIPCSPNPSYTHANGKKDDYAYKYGNLGYNYEGNKFGFHSELNKIYFCKDLERKECKEFDINDIVNYNVNGQTSSEGFQNDYCVYMGCLANPEQGGKTVFNTDFNGNDIEHSRGIQGYAGGQIKVPFGENLRIRNHEYDPINVDYEHNIVYNLCEETENTICGTENKVKFYYDQYAGPELPDSFGTWYCNKLETCNKSETCNKYKECIEKGQNVESEEYKKIEEECEKIKGECKGMLDSECTTEKTDKECDYATLYDYFNIYSEEFNDLTEILEQKKQDCENKKTNCNNNCKNKISSTSLAVKFKEGSGKRKKITPGTINCHSIPDINYTPCNGIKGTTYDSKSVYENKQNEVSKDNAIKQCEYYCSNTEEQKTCEDEYNLIKNNCVKNIASKDGYKTTYYNDFKKNWPKDNAKFPSSNELSDYNTFNKNVYEIVRDNSEEFMEAVGTNDTVKTAVLNNIATIQLTSDLITTTAEDEIKSKLTGDINLDILKSYTTYFYKHKNDDVYYLFIGSLNNSLCESIKMYVDNNNNKCTTDICNNGNNENKFYVYSSNEEGCTVINEECKTQICNSGDFTCIPSSSCTPKCEEKTFECKNYVKLSDFLNKYQTIYENVINSFKTNRVDYTVDYKYNDTTILTFDNIKSYYDNLNIKKTICSSSTSMDDDIIQNAVNCNLNSNTNNTDIKYNYTNEESNYKKYYNMYQYLITDGNKDNYIDLLNNFITIKEGCDYWGGCETLNLPYLITVEENNQSVNKDLYFVIDENNTKFSICFSYKEGELCLNTVINKTNNDYNLQDIYSVSYTGVEQLTSIDNEIIKKLLNIYNNVYLNFDSSLVPTDAVNTILEKIESKKEELREWYETYFKGIMETACLKNPNIGFFAEYECSIEDGKFVNKTPYTCKQRCTNTVYNYENGCYKSSGDKVKEVFFNNDRKRSTFGEYYVGIRLNDTEKALRYGETSPIITINADAIGTDKDTYNHMNATATCSKYGYYTYDIKGMYKGNSCFGKSLVSHNGDGHGVKTCIGFKEFGGDVATKEGNGYCYNIPSDISSNVSITNCRSTYAGHAVYTCSCFKYWINDVPLNIKKQTDILWECIKHLESDESVDKTNGTIKGHDSCAVIGLGKDITIKPEIRTITIKKSDFGKNAVEKYYNNNKSNKNITAISEELINKFLGTNINTYYGGNTSGCAISQSSHKFFKGNNECFYFRPVEHIDGTCKGTDDVLGFNYFNKNTTETELVLNICQYNGNVVTKDEVKHENNKCNVERIEPNQSKCLEYTKKHFIDKIKNEYIRYYDRRSYPRFEGKFDLRQRE